MSIIPHAFWIFLLVSLFIGWQAGDHTAKKIVLVILLAAIATSLAGKFLDTDSRRAVVLIIDFCLLFAVWFYALRSTRFWPIWFSGFHAAAVAFGTFGLFLAEPEKSLFFFVSACFAGPSLIVLVVGSLLDLKNDSRAQTGRNHTGMIPN